MFAREGAKLVIADTNDDGGHQTVHMITEQGGEAIFVRTDVTHAIAVDALISTAVETYGRLDCAYNNAGIAGTSAPSQLKVGVADTGESWEPLWEQGGSHAQEVHYTTHG
jgi:NAD(P)-dependent dehydrogenase (short-subunit alcohol dehydrogenase family)